MARHEHLIIFKSTYDFLIMIMHLTGHFPREHKFTLGEKMQNCLFDVVELIYIANSEINKTPHINKILAKMQMLRIYLRVASDMRLISTSKHAEYIQITETIIKHAHAWMNATSKPNCEEQESVSAI